MFLLLASCGRAADFSGPAREMRTQLAEKILPYWFDTAQDTNRGGYLLADDAVHGRQLPAEKQIVTQSRMVWALFACAPRRLQQRESELFAGGRTGLSIPAGPFS